MAAIVIEIPDNMDCNEFNNYLDIVVDRVNIVDLRKMPKYNDFKKSIKSANYFNCDIEINY